MCVCVCSPGLVMWNIHPDFELLMYVRETSATVHAHSVQWSITLHTASHSVTQCHTASHSTQRHTASHSVTQHHTASHSTQRHTVHSVTQYTASHSTHNTQYTESTLTYSDVHLVLKHLCLVEHTHSLHPTHTHTI